MKVHRVMLGAVVALIVSGCTTTTDLALQRNKELVCRYFDAWVNRGNPAVADELIGTNVVLHNPPAVLKGLEEYKTRMAAFHAAFPDGRYSIEYQVAEADRVAVHWTLEGRQSGPFQGRPATGRPFTVSGTSIFRIAEGKIQEITVNMDRLGMMEQLGWLPAVPPK